MTTAGEIISEKARKAKNNRRRGDAFERAVCIDQERIGRVAFRVRQGGGEPVDVVSMDAAGGQVANVIARVVFIQCKSGTRGPYIPPAELEGLCEKARLAGAVPMVAWRDGKTIQYKVLS